MNIVKEKLNRNEVTIGTWMQIPNASVAEILSANGYDWIALDLEHGSFSISQIPDIIRAIKLNNALPFIRVAQNHPKDIKQALDAGAEGIIVPMIDTLEQVKDFISWSSYPPEGTRGIGYSKANLFGKNFNQYFENINQDLVRVIQIENVKAISEIDQILSVSGIDAIMIGPYDLSGSMNLTGQFSHPDYLKVIETLQRKSLDFNVPIGTHIVEPDQTRLKAEIDLGKKFIAYSTDAMMLNKASDIYLRNKLPEI